MHNRVRLEESPKKVICDFMLPKKTFGCGRVCFLDENLTTNPDAAGYASQGQRRLCFGVPPDRGISYRVSSARPGLR